ncbi:jg545 [Pararge aegeria aegeria]|uniref:Jg545 protein n=2 Tax=Pararge aegeria TaxID=116150 RepID=A0A8S4QXB1_9NEOP|nr:jg545 [Pararge aegeria aegeria]
MKNITFGKNHRQVRLCDSPNVPSLKYINENLAGELNASLRKLISGIIDDCEDPDMNDPDSSEDENKTAEKRSRTVHSIKEKAMTNAVDPMNHLVTAEERKQPTTSSKAKSDLKNPTGKVKSSSHTQMITPSLGKLNIADVKRKSKRDIDIEDSDGGNDGNGDFNDAVLDIAKFHKVPADNNARNYETTTQDLLQRLSELPGLDIQIESLPLILRPGDLGDEIEIEVIDHAKSRLGDGNKIQIKNSNNATTSSSEDDEPLSVKAGVIKTYNKNKRDRKQLEVNEPQFPVKKKEKREQKRREIKSKFKRLGMLPVANFEDQSTNVKGDNNKDKDKARTK